jgi:hypothetical protein
MSSQTVEATGEGTVEFANLSDEAQSIFRSAARQGIYRTYEQLPPAFYGFSHVSYNGEMYALNTRFSHEPQNVLTVLGTTEPGETGVFDIRDFDSLPQIGKDVF